LLTISAKPPDLRWRYWAAFVSSLLIGRNFCPIKSNRRLASTDSSRKLGSDVMNTSVQSVKARLNEMITNGCNRQSLDELRMQLTAIYADLLRLEREFEPQLAECALHKESARNLIHYLALRRHDIRQLQEELAAVGLSSLGRMESHVMAGIEAVLRVLHQLAGCEWASLDGSGRGLEFAEGKTLLRVNTDRLLGPPPQIRGVRIMVTVPREAAEDYQLVRQLVANGMNCMRVNCAHDDAEAWSAMIANLQCAKEELGRECRVEMDLAGPKLRTGSIDPKTQIVKWRPQRDVRGQVVTPAQVWLTPLENPDPAPREIGGCLQVSTELLAKMRKGDSINFKDLRGKSRVLDIGGAHGRSRMAASAQTVYLNAGAALAFTHISRVNGAINVSEEANVGPPKRSFILLKVGDSLVLTRSPDPGHPAFCNAQGQIERSATISCTLPEIFADLHPNESVWFDDGKMGGVIESVSTERVTVRITTAKPGGDKLGADKGINFPNSTIRLPAMTKKDIANLAFVVRHADIVGLSFVRRPGDVAGLQTELARLNAPDLGIMLKIETRTAFEHLPAILLQAMQSGNVGVMIARGDLAVECGWERLAEVQEEILWVCEAAHAPVIWATQVLENLAKTGAPSRAEITDAAMGERAECVMLNKGPHLPQAVQVLNDILCRMEAHQSKKSARLRRLRLSEVSASQFMRS
jgi:pyruvate kinase